MFSKSAQNERDNNQIKYEGTIIPSISMFYLSWDKKYVICYILTSKYTTGDKNKLVINKTDTKLFKLEPIMYK